jgi:hypothetical protein
VNVSNRTRTATALVAGAALFAAVSAGADAIPDTFNVSTTISASCSVTDSGPADLTPTYTPSTDSGVGASTTLNTNCNGTSPTVTFTDADGGGPAFFMFGTGGVLIFQLSNNTSCNGSPADNPLVEAEAYSLGTGISSYNICAAITTGGDNVLAAAGTYTDTITYTISP